MRRKRRKQSITENRESGVKSRKISIFKEFLRHDKSIIHLPWHSSFMIMHTFAEWGNTGQNKADGKSDTTDLTTKGARLAV